MAGADDCCPPAVPTAPLAVQHQAEEGPEARGRKRTHDACYHTQQCRWCKSKKMGRCKRQPADCKACEDEQEKAAGALAAAAGSSAGGSTSPRVLWSQKKTRQEEEEEEEEEMQGQKEEDEEEEEVRDPRYSADDIRDLQGELNRELLFLTTFDVLRPPEDGPLSAFWKQKLGDMQHEIRELLVSYCKFKRCVPPSNFFFHHSFILSIPPF